LWNKIRDDYKKAFTFSDYFDFAQYKFWKAYEAVFPAETHQSVGKETGETAHAMH